MQDYLTEEEKKELEEMGYTSYKGEYGMVYPSLGPQNILGKINTPTEGREDSVELWLMVDKYGVLGYNDLQGMLSSRARKTLAPIEPAPEMRIKYFSYDWDGVFKIYSPDDVKKVNEWLTGVGSTDYDIYLKKRVP